MLNKVKITNFRNFTSKEISFNPKITLIVGENATGKTNILESIHLSSTGKSFKAKVEEEMIKSGEEIGRVEAEIQKESLIKLEIVLTRGVLNLGTAHPEKVARKRLLVNGIARRLIDFAGNQKVVLFSPQDLDLVTQSPSIRRKFLDSVLSQVDREYRRAALSYEKGLRQRNKILFKIREGLAKRSYLAFWDRLLIKNGDYISQKRADFIAFVNSTEALNSQAFSLNYDKSAISESRLEEYSQEEVAAATTLVGPHRDDFRFTLKKLDLGRFASRGEQRMGVLWLKLAELEFIKKETEDAPTLLLDDIFSELDDTHRKVVLEMASQGQTIITTADPHHTKSFKGVQIINL